MSTIHIKQLPRELALSFAAKTNLLLLSKPAVGKSETVGATAKTMMERVEGFKHWKFDMGDIAVRKQWADYQKAYETLLSATHTPWAPWTIVPSNSKTHRNLMIATVLREVLQNLDLKYPPGDPALEHFTVE